MDASLFYMDLLELGIIMHRSRWQTGVTGHMSNGAHIWHLFVKCQKIKHLHYGGGSQKKIKLTQWGSHILTSILTSHMLVTKNPQNVHRNYFGQFCWPSYLTSKLTSISVNLIMSIYLFFLWTSSIVCMFDFLIFDIFLTTWHLFDILTHQLNLNHLSPHSAIFSFRPHFSFLHLSLHLTFHLFIYLTFHLFIWHHTLKNDTKYKFKCGTTQCWPAFLFCTMKENVSNPELGICFPVRHTFTKHHVIPHLYSCWK